MVTKAHSPCCYHAGLWRVTRTLYLRCCVWVGITVLVKPTFTSGVWVNACHRARMTQSLEIMMAIQVMG